MTGLIFDEKQDLHDFGACCVCEEEKKDVNNFIMLPYEAPEPGTGWGCFVCELESNGASAVVCCDCLIKLQNCEAEIKFIVNGYPGLKQRTSLEDYIKIPFIHDMKKHNQFDGWTATVP